MSEPGWSEVLAEHRVEESPAERSVRMARQAAERQDRAALADDAERAAAIEAERDRRMVAYSQLGIAGRSVGEVFAEATAAGDEDAQYADAQKTIERIEKRRSARREAARFQAEQIAAVSRAQVPADPLEAAQRRAHQAFAQATRAQLSGAVTGAPPRARRPFASRGSVAVRSEQCVHCINQGVDPETSFLLHSDPELNVPVTSPEQAREAEQAERRQYSSYAEIAR